VSKGKPLATLRDAAQYITKLPKADHDASEWQTAMHRLIESGRQRRANRVCAHGHDARA